MSRPAAFVDRDGVINAAIVREGKPYAPTKLDDVTILPGVAEGLHRLKAAGFAIVVITNQPDVARGLARRADIEAIDAHLAAALPVDEFRVCYHDDRDDCPCRKPKPGLLLQAPWYDLSRSVLIGDRWRDIEAGQRAHVSATILVDYQYDEPIRVAPTVRMPSLGAAVPWILEWSKGARMKAVSDLRVKIFGDGAELAGMLALYRQPFIKGFTTNPTLMKKAGIRDYAGFAREVLSAIPDRPISFEVFSDDFPDMARQARVIAAWGPNVYVKIPVTTTRRESACDLIHELSHEGIKLNVTALMTLDQVRDVVGALRGGAPSCVSVFAGRIADTGRDPVPLMAAAVELVRLEPKSELIWASPRELLNIFQADEIGCDIITVTHDILKKLDLVGHPLDEFSLDTVKMFHGDGTAAGFAL